MTMIPVERQNFILDALARAGVLSIATLTRELGVSHMTIRRDIHQLEREGRVMSVAGGIRLPERIHVEPSHQTKAGLFHAEKAAIGAHAAAMIEPGGTIYLDAGTTTLEIARHLVDRDDLTVVTNDFMVSALLTGNGRCRLHHTGGRIERENRSCVGEGAADAIRRFNFDMAFLSTSSWGMRGISTPAEEKTVVKRAAVECSQKRILVTDSSKYGKVGAFFAVPLEELSMIITDDAMPPAARAALRDSGVELEIAR